MMRRALFAAAAASACLLAAPASAGTLDSYPIVTPGASDKLCGYANATGHATQCATAQTIANLAQPAGAAGQVQWNNGSVFAGANTMVYCATCNGGGPLFALTTPVTITNQAFTLNNGSTNWLTASSTGGGGQVQFTSGGVLNWTNSAGLSLVSAGVLGIGNGAAGDKSGQLDVLSIVVGSGGTLTLPDGGTINSSLYQQFVPLVLRGGSAGMAAPTLGIGYGTTYIDGAAHWNDNAHTNSSKGGLALWGHTVGSCVPGAYSQCYQYSVGLYSGNGVVVATVEDQGNWFSIGSDRFMSCPAQGDQGCALQGSDYVSQLLINDAVVGGSYDEPMLVFQSGNQVGGLTGIGHALPGTIGSNPVNGTPQNIMRFGAIQDLNTGWDDNAVDQPDWGVEGCFQLGSQNGSHAVATGGVGVTWDAAICDVGGVMTVQNSAKTSTAPISAYFNRPHSGTLAQLNTADPTPADGDAGFINDAASCTFMSAVAGGGSTHCPVHYDSSSTSWKAG